MPGRGIDWVLNTLPPGASTGEFVAHRRGVSEYIFVLKGRLLFRRNSVTGALEAGPRGGAAGAAGSSWAGLNADLHANA